MKLSATTSLSVRKLFFYLGLLSFFELSQTCLAQETLQIPLAKRAPVLTEYIKNIPDDAGVIVDRFRQRDPGDGEPSSREMKAFLSYDDAYLYAVFVVKADPKQLRAHIGKRDNLDGQDKVILEIDSFNDKQRAFLFYVNPYGVQADAKRTEGLEDDFNFDTQWISEGEITDDGYVAKMVIPLKSLRFHHGKTQIWGIAVGQSIMQTYELVFWPHISNRIAGRVNQYATLEINEEFTSGRNIQINPYIALGKSRNMQVVHQDSVLKPIWETNQHMQAGVDAKMVLGDAFALDFTLRPDFSEVESDQPQVIVDKRYEVLFPEKRPFFLENAGFFQTPQALFFSRRIVDPEYGARLTGREGKWSVGSLIMNDNAAGDNLPPDNVNHSKDSKNIVARIQNDFAKNSYFGLLTTHRQFSDQSNTVAGADFRWGVNDNWIITGQLAKSVQHSEFSQIKNGNLAYLETLGTGRNFKYSGKYLSISPDFDTTLAFLPRTNIQQTIQEASYLWYLSDHPWIGNIGPKIIATGTKNHDNQWQDRSIDTAVVLQSTGANFLELHAMNAMENYAGKNFYKNGFLMSLYSDSLAWLTADVALGGNQVINYSPSANIEPFLGLSHSLAATLTVKTATRWRLDQSFFWNDLKTSTVMSSKPSGTLIYRDLLSRSSLAYQHNRFFGVRLILDYHFLKTNAALSSLESGKRLNTNLQMSYVLNPGTTFYVGYSDRQQNLRLIGSPSILQETQNLDLHTGKAVFMKLNYLFQL